MDFKELCRALDGMSAYDQGCTDSGIHDPELKAKVADYIESLPVIEREALFSKATRELYMTDEAIASGYTLEDVVKFKEWLEHDLFY